MKYLYYTVKPYFMGSDKRYAWGMGGVLLLLALSKVYCGFLYANWNKRFYGAIETKQYDLFLNESLYFVLLSLVFVFLVSLSSYLCKRYALRWRLWFTDYALKLWLPKAHEPLEGVDQRIQEDLMRFTDIIEQLALELFNNTVIVCTFTPLLLKLTYDIPIFGVKMPGILFYAVLLYTVVGFVISRSIAKPLLNLEYDSQKYEAALRDQLVRAKLGAVYQARDFATAITNIVHNHVGLYRRQSVYTFWQTVYDQFSFLIPVLLIAPGFFSGVVSFAVLMQIRSIFSRIRNAMAYILDHYASLMDLMATAKRIHEFQRQFESPAQDTPAAAHDLDRLSVA